MKKYWKGLLAVLLLLSMLLPGISMATLDCGSHEWGEWDETREPTCTTKGIKIRYCHNCMTMDEAEIPALGHDYGNWEVLRQPTCREAGTKQRVCSRCKDVQTETIPMVGHEYGEWTVTKEPTCTETGSRVRYCRYCQNAQTESIAAKGHTLAERVVKQPTCGEDGKKEKYCTVCGAVTETSAVKKTGNHSYGDWVVTKEATCKANGSKTRTCTVCGDKQTETISKSTAHQYGDWVVTTAASCTSAGVKTKTCSICGVKQTETIPKLEHSFGDWEVQKAATCTKDGKERRVCKVCGASKHRVIKKLGHTYSNWEIIEEATDHSKGKRSAKCDLCGKKTTESFYPDGTLYKGGDNPVDMVKKLQQALADLGLYKGKISGKFDNATASAVSKFEKNYLGMKGDGIAWPKVLKGLLPGGIGGDFDGPNTSDTSKVKLLLEVDQISPKKDFYAPGDEITFKWTLINKAKKDTATSVRMYHYKGMKADKKKDLEIGQPETLIPDEKVTDTFVYKVTEDDALAGQFTVGFIGRCKYGKKDSESNKVWFNYSAAGAGSGVGSGGWTPPSEQQLAVSKKVENEPANKFFFVKGETITYTISVANISKVDVDNVLLTDKLFPGLDVGSFSIKAGDIKFFAVSYKVKAEDIPNGEVINTAIATYTGSDGKLKSAKASEKAPVGLDTNSLYLYKTAVSTPANGLFYLPGEIITYEITVVNPTDRTFTDVRLYDDLNTDPDEPIKKIGTMKPHTVKTVTFKHHTSKFEAKIGKVINVARATYVNPKKTKIQESSNVRIVPAGLENSDGVIVKKVIISTPANGKYYEDAEEIRYMIEVTNNTVQDITDMDVRDSLAPIDSNGFRTVYEHETLLAGETKSYPFSFLVGPADVENTIVTNVASAYWTIDGTDYFETYSDPVYAPTAEVAVPRVAKPVNLDGATCENPLTAVGDGVAEHDVTECDDHTETAAESRKLVESKDYGAAKTMWDEEIDELYGEWEENTDAEGARNAEDEQAAFDFQLGALESSLSLICSEEEVQSIVVEERMNKCVRLCYELHSAPETRSDSLSGDHASASKAKSSDECKHEATYLANGSAHVVDGQCETHKQTMQLTSRLLENAEDDDARLIAWKRAQGNWLLQLNTMYDKWYLASDETQRAKIAADRISFDRLIEARKKTLADLYPDDPATAAEVLANMIMERTELICRLLHEAGILKD